MKTTAVHVTEEVHFLFEQSIRTAPSQSPIPEKDWLEIFSHGSCFFQLKPFCTIQLEFLCPQGVAVLSGTATLMQTQNVKFTWNIWPNLRIQDQILIELKLRKEVSGVITVPIITIYKEGK